MADDSSLHDNPTPEVTEDIFTNFEKLESMANQVLLNLGPSKLPAINFGVTVAGTSLFFHPLRQYGNKSCNILSDSVFQRTPQWKSTDHNTGSSCNFAQWTTTSNRVHGIECASPSINLAHVVAVEEELLDAGEAGTPIHWEGVEKSGSAISNRGVVGKEAVQTRRKRFRLPSEEKRRMGKEKETFEAWKKPRRRVSAGSHGNPSEVDTVCGRGQPQTETQDFLKKPRGIKRTFVQRAAVVELLEEERETGIGNESEQTSKLGGSGSVPMKKLAATSTGKEPVYPPRKVGNEEMGKDKQTQTRKSMQGMEERRNEKLAELQIPVTEDIVKQRPGKERACTPSSSSEQNPLSLTVSGERRMKANIQEDYDAADFDNNVAEHIGTRGESSKERRRRQCSNSYSSEESLSSPTVRRRIRRRHVGIGRQRRGRSWERRHRSRVEYTGADSYSEEYNSGRHESDEDRRRQRRKTFPDKSPNIPRQSRKKPDYSHSEESSGSSDEQARYKRHSRELTARKPELESPKSETKKRQERRSKQGERETERRMRERQGLKGHYISVNHIGMPYGFGVGAWRAELNKLCRGLDPSITNIRYQPEEAMATVRRRLKDTFEYSAPVDRAYIRKLAGKMVTQRRSRILNLLRDGEDCPSGLDADVWKRLDRIRKDPNREELSQRMKYANSARVNKGRTGPKGEDGIREDLYRELSREPDPLDVQFEMRRKKGYGGVSRKRQEILGRQHHPPSDGEDEEVRGEEMNERDPAKLKWPTADVNAGTTDTRLSLILQMEKELKELRAQMKASNESAIPEAVEDGGPSTSMRICGPESNTTSNLANAMTYTMQVMTRDQVTEEENHDGHDNQASPPRKKLRARKRV